MPYLSLFRPAAVLAALLLAAAPLTSAIAQVVTFARAGSWEAFGGVTNDGKRMCGISSSGPDMWFGVKYFQGDSGLTVQASSGDWALKRGVQVKVEMQFDNEDAWSAVATGFHMPNGKGALEFEIPGRAIRQWMAEFRASNRLHFGFPEETDVDDWEIDLGGTSEISDRLAACIDAL